MSRWGSSGAFVLLFLLSPGRALADSDGDARAADALYEEAIALIKSENYASACPKLEESQRLDPGLGTQFHLAGCYDHVGKLVKALELYRSVLTSARAADKQKLARLADERLKELTPRVPRLRLSFASPEPTAEVFVDGARVTSTDWTKEGTTIDTGRHQIEVRVGGKLPWRASPTAREGDVVNLTVGELTPVPPPPAPAPEPPPASPLQSLRPVWAVTAGVGLVVTAVGATAGIIALRRRDDAREACGSDEPKQCRNQAAVGEWDKAMTAANVSTIGLVTGGALLATGGVLWFLSGGAKPRIVAGADARGAGVGLVGKW
jgi:hypothetical protein